MHRVDRSYPELSYNEISEKAAFARLAIDALRKGRLDSFQLGLLDDAIRVCEIMRVGYNASNSDQISVSELGPYNLVRPFVQKPECGDTLKNTDEVLGLLKTKKDTVAMKPLSARDHRILAQYFASVADTYLDLATELINKQLR